MKFKFLSVIPNITFLDFEFSKIYHPRVDLVCCTTYRFRDGKEEILDWWLRGDDFSQSDLAAYLNDGPKGEVIFGYAAVAEGRSFQSLGLDPVKFPWIDGFFEYRQLTNHNDLLLYGSQLVNGVVRNTIKPPPKWERTEEDSQGSFKPTHSLAEATYKLTGKIRDTEHKDKMRDLIISDPDKFTEEERTAIMAYCREDVVFLPQMFEKMIEEYSNLGFPFTRELVSEMLLRGKYAALTAKMESLGYPINLEKTRNFSSAVGPILDECQREINSLFPEIKPFRYNRAERKFSWDQKATKNWLKENADIRRWMKTDGLKKAKKAAVKDKQDEVLQKEGRKKITTAERQEAESTVDSTDYLSLSGDAWQQQFDFKHDYPKDNFGAQMVRYLKLKQNLNGFTPNKNGSFWDAVGPDGRVRPYFNPFGSLTGRSQPGSRSFLFLKPAWMRALCEPQPGKAICGVDYGSEEYLISALVSEDDEMFEAYDGGDVYLAFAIASGMAPKGATKHTHKKERQLAKAAVLGMSYLMTSIGLAVKLSADTGRPVSEDEAQELIDSFYEVYYDLGKWQQQIQKQYASENYLTLPCGWMLLGDNDNFRSVVNFSIQGLGGSIMRKAVEFCDEVGLNVIITLHDALYIEYDIGDEGAVDKLMDCMRRAFVHYFPDYQKSKAEKIKMDPFCWSPNYPAPEVFFDPETKKKEKKFHTITTPAGLKVDVSDIYVDERAEAEYEQFSKYFTDMEENAL